MDQIIEAIITFNEETELETFWTIIADELKKPRKIFNDWVTTREDELINFCKLSTIIWNRRQ